MKEILERIEVLFTEKLKSKTSWGRNEVITIYKDCQLEALRENLNTSPGPGLTDTSPAIKS